ncbi:MAG: SAM-dependent methyltransferase [Gammaproteobacteria bacterium RIFCSPHIGHO2_12_FULL_38_14]|nr:MAG: SAM-dependent methyltransferase [Gammaproteobacteria bacterium RIFCSPHIGHO2_12_FULL_38_14]
MSRETIELTSSLFQYLKSHSLREPLVLQKLRQETATLPAARMQISPEQGQLMALLVELLDAKKTLDIGTFTGYSALVVAFSLPKNGKVIACDMSRAWTDIAKRYWQEAGCGEKIDLRLAPALDTLHTLIDAGEGSTFDFAFIDADKNNYINYYETSLCLLRKGGLIAIDNVLWSGKVADPDVNDEDTIAIRRLNDHVKNDERVTLSMIPIGDGLTLARKR